jgi:8-oxo-dGTP diphosphatase
MAKDRFKLSSAVYLLLVRDNKILLLRRYNTGWSDGLYSLAAGHIDGQEPLTLAMCREAKEEAGITVNPKDLAFVHVMHRIDRLGDKKEYLDFFFTASNWEGEPYNAEPEKCDDIQWFELDNLPENILPYIRQVIEDFKNGVYFSETGWHD